jgi:hypothetical protein
MQWIWIWICSAFQIWQVKEVHDVRVAQKEHNFHDAGFKPVNVTISMRTARNYHAGLALHDNGMPLGTDFTHPKMNACWTMERSLIAAKQCGMSTLVTTRLKWGTSLTSLWVSCISQCKQPSGNFVWQCQLCLQWLVIKHSMSALMVLKNFPSDRYQWTTHMPQRQ